VAHRLGQLHAAAVPQDFAQAHARFVELRFGGADAAAQRLGNFVMFVTQHVMQKEDLPVTTRELP
jgi:hypothetical protein